MFPDNKDRLYLALYARGGMPTMPGREDAYHWALIVASKTNPDDDRQAIRFHAKESMSADSSPPRLVWAYEEQQIDRGPQYMLLTRVIIGKVLDKGRLRSIIGGIPVRPETPGWNCVGWVREAVDAVLRDDRALGTTVETWAEVKDTAMHYIEAKRASHRFDGQGKLSGGTAATWDMLQNKEVIP
ncbi:hypothetical protein F5Y14DRAFT_447391 [Nemania sp. NC0429]|nr:hypothetical protein F5Y14DRAFT_447391 [Nemania sp. NC0429]